MLKDLLHKWAAPALCGAALICVANRVEAQVVPASAAAPASPAATLPATDDVQARIERLERQNQQLMEMLQKLQAAPQAPPALPPGLPTAEQAPPASGDVRSIVTDILKEQDRKKAEAEAIAKKKAADEGSVVGANLGLAARWNHGLWLESADKAFKVHVGGRTQWDVVNVGADNNVMFGNGGIGDYDDAVNFRRARLAIEGTFWEIFNFNCEYDFLNTTQAVGAVNRTPAAGPVTGISTTNNTFNTPVPTDLWVEITKLPWIGNLRIGNQKPPIGFEHMTSSRFLNFLERSYQFDAFIEDGNNGFTAGIQAYNWTENERATLAVGWFHTNRQIFGWNVGDGEAQVTTRGTWLPYWADNGRSFVHVGLGAQYRDLDDNVARYRSRTLIRNGPAVLHNVAAISQVQGDSQMLLNPEFVVQAGPFLIQSEYTASYTHDVINIIRTPTQSNVVIPGGAEYFAQAAYVEALYFLTGEHRDYNKKQPGLGRVIPYRNAFWVPGEGCGNLFQGGAWQVGARYSWIDLTNSGINGGTINSLTLGLNWFLNPNFKIQTNYEYARRDLNAPSTSNGEFYGWGMRFAFDF